MSLFMWNLIYSKHRREEFLSSVDSKYFEYIHWENKGMHTISNNVQYKNKIKLVYFSKHSTGVYWTGVSRSLRFNYETGCKLRK